MVASTSSSGWWEWELGVQQHVGVGGRGEVQLTARREEEDAVNLRPPEGTHEPRLGGASLKSHESSRERERGGRGRAGD